jgi:Integrase core domain
LRLICRASLVVRPVEVGVSHGAAFATSGYWPRRRLPERFADALAGASSVRVAVQLADELAAVTVAELGRDHSSSVVLVASVGRVPRRWPTVSRAHSGDSEVGIEEGTGVGTIRARSPFWNDQPRPRTGRRSRGWISYPDNAMAEAWVATFKSELVDGRRFPSFEHAEHEALHWIGFYNGERPQEALGDLPAAEYEELNIKKDNTPMLSAT